MSAPPAKPSPEQPADGEQHEHPVALVRPYIHPRTGESVRQEAVVAPSAHLALRYDQRPAPVQRPDAPSPRNSTELGSQEYSVQRTARKVTVCLVIGVIAAVLIIWALPTPAPSPPPLPSS